MCIRDRGHRGTGRGGSSEARESSRSTSAQQQHQKNNPGFSGSGSCGAAPQRTVKVDASSTTASAPAVLSAASPGASMARNRQVPRRRGSAIGVASEVILRETAWRHSQWHQVGSRGNLLHRASSALRIRAKTGVTVVLEGRDLPMVADLRGPLQLNSSTRRTIPGSPDRGRVERLHNGLYRWTRVPPLLRRRWRRRRCRQQQRRARCLPLHRG